MNLDRALWVILCTVVIVYTIMSMGLMLWWWFL